MNDLITGLKTLGVSAALMLVFIGGPILGSTAFLRQALHAIWQFTLVMGALVGIIVAPPCW